MSTPNATSRYLRTRFPLVLAIVWLAAMFVMYYIRHNPLAVLESLPFDVLGAKLSAGLSAPNLLQRVTEAVGLNLVDTLAVVLLTAIGGGLGAWLLPGVDLLPERERPVVQVLAGLGLIAIVVLVAGLVGKFPPRWLAWVIAVLLVAALHRPIIRWGKAFWVTCRDLLNPAGDGLSRWMGWCILILLALPLVIALLPPIQWDTLTYHLEGPRLYLDAGRIISFPENHFLGFPQTVEMLYLWLMIAARANASGLLHWVFSLMAVLLTISLGRRSGHPLAGTLAAIGFLACDSLWNELTFPYNDLALVAFVTAALCAILTWIDSQDANRGRLLIVAGVFVGLSMATKYTAAGAAIGIAGLVAWGARKDGMVSILRSCALVTVVAIAVFSPTLIKNALIDGNPVSPFLWGTSAFDRFDQDYYLRAGTGLDPVSVVLAPIQGTVFGVDRLAPYGSSTGVMAFTLLPLALLGWKRRDQGERELISRLAIFVIPPYLIWVAGIATSWYLVQTRLLYPIFPAFLAIGCLGVEGLAAQRPQPDPSIFARLIAAAAGTIAIWVGLFPTVLSDHWLVEIGLTPVDDYLTAHVGSAYTATQKINELPGEPKIQMLWEPRTYYCKQDCIPDSGIDLWWHERQIEDDPHTIIASWRAKGITHVLIHESGLRFLTTEDPYEPLTDADVDALNEARRDDLIEIWQIPGAYTLYEIRGTTP